MSNVGRKGTRFARVRRRPFKERQLIFKPDAWGRVIGRPQQKKKDVDACGWVLDSELKTTVFAFIMNKSVKTGLIGISLLVVLLLIILLINLQYSSSESSHPCLQLVGEQTCESTNKNSYRYYGTKTAYHVVLSNESDTKLKRGNCQPQLFYLFCRHATRYPDRKDIEKMIAELPNLKERIINSSSEGKTGICEQDIEKLKRWNLTLVPEYDNQLSESGKEEAIALAQRFKQRFPSLLNGSYSPGAFVFEYTSRQRSQTTAESFAKGLFEDKGSGYKPVVGKANDEVTQFHKECEVHQKQCNASSLDLTELQKFKNGPLLKSLPKSISKRLGFEVDLDDIKLMYRACVFGYALENDSSWCPVFSKSELKIMEFDADIDDYYKDGYGNKLNYEQACPVVRHVVDSFKQVNSRPSLKAVLQFSHAGAIKKVFTRFGLFKDETPIMADDLCKSHKWRSSIIAPFTSNLALVLFKCGQERKVAAFHNEKPVVIGGCTELLCPIEHFYSTYNSIATECDIPSICCTCCLES